MAKAKSKFRLYVTKETLSMHETVASCTWPNFFVMSAADPILIQETVVVGGIPTARATRSQLVSQMIADCDQARTGQLALPRVVVSSNGSVIAAFHLQRDFRDLLLQADVVDADGMPLVLATRLLCKRPLKERVATTDFIHDAAAAAAREGLRFFFLGGQRGVAEKAAASLRERHPNLKIVGIRHGFFDESEEELICSQIRRAKADVVWVGLGSPRQENFAIANRFRLGGVGWVRTCGGMFDHCSGKIRRAPEWMQAVGLEWLHRLIQEPRRLSRRYLTTNPVAAYYLATRTHD